MVSLLLASVSMYDSARLPIPPPMPKRQIAKWDKPWPGDAIEIVDGDRKFTLFIPSAWKPTKDVALTIHFHSAQWHAIQEHVSRGLAGPLIAFYPGEGSTIYGKSFEEEGRLERWFQLVLKELAKRGASTDARIATLDVSSFSAGFGAVRQILQDPKAFALLRRVVLSDSMYGGLDPAASTRKVAPEHVQCWLTLVQAAIKGEKTFCMTYSEVATPTYASSSECAAAIVAAVGGTLAHVEPGSLAATLDRELPLKTRFDRGCFHVWGYGGDDGQAHMTHARHLADVWLALDLVGHP